MVEKKEVEKKETQPQVDLLDFDAGATANAEKPKDLLLDLYGGPQPGQQSNTASNLLDMGTTTGAPMGTTGSSQTTINAFEFMNTGNN